MRKNPMNVSVPRAIATWFGCGLVPFAPGTVGSLAGVLIALPLAPKHPIYLALLSAGFLPLAIWAADITEREEGRSDPGLVVVDEVLGQWMTLAGATHLNWRSYTAGFLLFRLFDIWKPAPVRQLEKLPGGAGIVADDMMAGIYGALVLFIMGWFNLY